jgi:hypothetical protein
MLELGVDLERMRRRTPIEWLQNAVVSIGSAGFGAWISGAGGWVPSAATFIGFSAAVALQLAVRERRVYASNVCGRYLRLLDQYTQLGEHDYATNAEYVRTVVAVENPSVKTRWENWKEARRSKKDAVTS